jgi:hypothetical protein
MSAFCLIRRPSSAARVPQRRVPQRTPLPTTTFTFSGPPPSLPATSTLPSPALFAAANAVTNGLLQISGAGPGIGAGMTVSGAANVSASSGSAMAPTATPLYQYNNYMAILKTRANLKY